VQGTYTPLTVDVAVEADVAAWMRSDGEHAAFVVAAVRTARLGQHQWPIGALWGPSRVLLPAGVTASRVRDLFTGAVHPVVETDAERWIFLSQAFAALPVSVLMPDV